MRARTERSRPVVRVGLAALVGAIALVAALVAPADPAAAVVLPVTHARLTASTPAPDAVLAQAPAEVVLTFNRQIAPPASVAVTAPSGTRVGVGEPLAREKVVTVPIAAGEQGTYTVGYRAVDVDGHPITGRFTFSIGHRSKPYAAPTSPATGGGNGWVWPVAAGGLVLVVGSSGLWWWRRRPA